MGSITLQKGLFATLHESGLLSRGTCIAGWCLLHSPWFILFLISFFPFFLFPHAPSFFFLPNNGLYNMFASSELSIWNNSWIFYIFAFTFFYFSQHNKVSYGRGYVMKSRMRNHFFLLLFFCCSVMKCYIMYRYPMDGWDMQILDLPNPVSAPIAKTAINQQNITLARRNWRIHPDSRPKVTLKRYSTFH